MVMEEATIVTGYGVTHHESAKFKLHSECVFVEEPHSLHKTRKYNKFAANRFLPALNEPLPFSIVWTMQLILMYDALLIKGLSSVDAAHGSS